MDFKTSSFMYIVAFCVIAFVLADSLFFLIRAVRRGKKLGMSTSVMRQTAVQSALFSIPAAIGIVMTIVALSGALGIVLPWIRLSVIGSVSYEVPVALTALDAVNHAGGLSVEVTDPMTYVTCAWVMTTGSIFPLVLVPVMTKRIQIAGGQAAKKNSTLMNALTAAAFIGLMGAFATQAITGCGDAAVLGDGAGIMSITALVVSILVMLAIMKFTQKHPNHWLDSLSMPIAMLCAMAVVCILGNVLPQDIAYLEWRT